MVEDFWIGIYSAAGDCLRKTHPKSLGCPWSEPKEPILTGYRDFVYHLHALRQGLLANGSEEAYLEAMEEKITTGCHVICLWRSQNQHHPPHFNLYRSIFSDKFYTHTLTPLAGPRFKLVNSSRWWDVATLVFIVFLRCWKQACDWTHLVCESADLLSQTTTNALIFVSYFAVYGVKNPESSMFKVIL